MNLQRQTQWHPLLKPRACDPHDLLLVTSYRKRVCGLKQPITHFQLQRSINPNIDGCNCSSAYAYGLDQPYDLNPRTGASLERDAADVEATPVPLRLQQLPLLLHQHLRSHKVLAHLL